MPQENDSREAQDRPAAGDRPAKAPKYDWQDPSIPAGDAPPMPRWPVVLGFMAWVGWMVFLVVMMTLRLQTTSV